MENEERLVDVNKLNVCYINTGTVMFPKIEAFVRADDIADAPTVDAVEVVHGRWIICSDGYFPYCSECKTEPKHGEMTNYCPNCGAKMDEERKNDGQA